MNIWKEGDQQEGTQCEGQWRRDRNKSKVQEHLGKCLSGSTALHTVCDMSEF